MCKPSCIDNFDTSIKITQVAFTHFHNYNNFDTSPFVSIRHVPQDDCHPPPAEAEEDQEPYTSTSVAHSGEIWLKFMLKC